MLTGGSASVTTISSLLKRKSSATALGVQKKGDLSLRPAPNPQSLGLEDRLGRRDINDTYFRQTLRTSSASNEKRKQISSQRSSISNSKARKPPAPVKALASSRGSCPVVVDERKLESFVRDVHISLKELGAAANNVSGRLGSQTDRNS